MARDYHCDNCGEIFKRLHKRHRFCSESCKGKNKYKTNQVTTASQYEKISGNWNLYCARLCNQWGRKEDGLTKEDLLGLLEQQDYKCALTGIEMTCFLEKGINFKTNMSIDRLAPGGPYIKENCRLVCKMTNIMRWTNSDEELVYWCKRIIEHVGT